MDVGSGDGLKAQHEESAGPTRETRFAQRELDPKRACAEVQDPVSSLTQRPGGHHPI